MEALGAGVEAGPGAGAGEGAGLPLILGQYELLLQFYENATFVIDAYRWDRIRLMESNEDGLEIVFSVRQQLIQAWAHNHSGYSSCESTVSTEV